MQTKFSFLLLFSALIITACDSNDTSDLMDVTGTWTGPNGTHTLVIQTQVDDDVTARWESNISGLGDVGQDLVGEFVSGRRLELYTTTNTSGDVDVLVRFEDEREGDMTLFGIGGDTPIPITKR